MNQQVRQALRDESDRLVEDCIYSAKGHFESAREWSWWNLILGLPSVVLAATAGMSGFNSKATLAGALAVFGGALAAILTFLKPSERASSHQAAGTLYNSLKNRARYFRDIDLEVLDDETDLNERLRQLSEDRNALGEASPRILRRAFERTRKGIEEGESEYAVDRR